MTEKQKQDLVVIESAVRRVISNLANGKAHKDILEEWDSDRGTSWFPKTRYG